MRRCLAGVYYFSSIGNRLRKIRTDITPYSLSSGLPLFSPKRPYSRSVGRSQWPWGCALTTCARFN